MTKRYSEQFKQESIQYVQSHPESGIASIAKQLGVGYSTFVNRRAILSRLGVETASNSFHLSVSLSSVLAGDFWSDLYGHVS